MNGSSLKTCRPTKKLSVSTTRPVEAPAADGEDPDKPSGDPKPSIRGRRRNTVVGPGCDGEGPARTIRVNVASPLLKRGSPAKH